MTQQTAIDANTSRLLAWLSKGWIPAPSPTGDLLEAKFGEDDISAEVRSVSFGPKELRITCEGVRGFKAMTEFTLKQVAGSTTGGWQLIAESAYISNSHFSPSQATYEISSNRAILRLAERSPRFWFGRVSLSDLSIGNLTIAMRKGDFTAVSYSNLLLNGFHTYHFVKSDKYTYLLIKATNASVYSDEILKELQLLQFALGTNFVFNSISGLDIDGTVVEYHIGSTVGRAEPVPQISPVPTNDPMRTWVAPFFGLLSQHFISDNRYLRFAIGYYLQSAIGYLDSKYLFLRFAVNLLAKYILHCKSPERLEQVHDVESWEKWISQEEQNIRQLAKQGSEDELVLTVQGARQTPISSIVRAALELLEIETTYFSNELNIWNQIEEHGWMTEEEPRDARRDLHRIAVLRTLFCALLSKMIGYKGPISGPPKDLGSIHPTIYWLPGANANEEVVTEATHVYVAQVDFDYPPAGTLWPDFTPPQQPHTGLLETIAEFGASLASHTLNTVTARLQLVPSVPGELSPTYDFVLTLVAKPEMQSLLFTVSVKEETLIIRNWKDEDLIIRDRINLDAFLSEVAHSKETQGRIESFMNFAESLKPAM